MNILIAALAAWQLIEAWQHSMLLSEWRAEAELIDGRLGELLCCPFCLSPWVALLMLSIISLANITGYCLDLPVQALACARLANLGNDLCHAFCRTPRFRLPEKAVSYVDPEITVETSSDPVEHPDW